MIVHYSTGVAVAVAVVVQALTSLSPKTVFCETHSRSIHVQRTASSMNQYANEFSETNMNLAGEYNIKVVVPPRL